jgi:hypothetical protein
MNRDPLDFFARHPRDILTEEDAASRKKARDMARLALAALHVRLGTNAEDDEFVPKILKADRFEPCNADRWYLHTTHYNVTEQTFEKERDRLPRMSAREDRSVPPGGLVCSARLGEVAKLL